ncbi:hypothetical protein N7461_007796 [Penicillium sp. DV-2018c]|nr:hypothetical protein N7461_007796 [Penicillium sp. DV-2018c]
MAPRRRAPKAVEKEYAADSRRTGRAAVSSANIGEQSGLAMTTQNEATSRTRTPRKAAARGKWSKEQLLTSDKSPLIDLDLVKLLAHPDAWNCLEESEKREILDLLPPDVHPEAQAITDDSDTKIPPIPDSFIRYSNNWRDGVRQFQIDLGNGRYNTEWLHQAQQARQQRENGEFDEFKEREYEQFWGQKQRVHWSASAGKSARVKLRTLIDEGVIQVGDVWRFSYVYGKGADRIVIDKETRIHEIKGAKLTFAIPPGERVFLRDTPRKDEHLSTPEKGQSDVNVNADADLRPAALPLGDGDTKVDEDAEPQDVILPPSNGDVKVGEDTENRPLATPPDDQKTRDEDSATHISITSSTGREARLDIDNVCQEDPKPLQDEVNPCTDSQTQRLTPSPNNEKSQGFSGILGSSSMEDQASKHTIPHPVPQPPPKRKRGRPRRVPPKQPESELAQGTKVNQDDKQDKPERPLPVVSVLEPKIAESQRNAAEPSSPAHSHPVSSHQNPSCLPCSSGESAEAPTKAEEPHIAAVNTNLQTDPTEQAMILDSSVAQSDTDMHGAEAPTKAEESHIAAVNTNLQTDPTEQAMILDSSVAQSDTDMHGAEVDQHASGPDTATEQHQDTMAQADTAMRAVKADVEVDQRGPDTNAATVPSQISNAPDEIVPNIASPRGLGVKILQIDGRIPNGPIRQVWKSIRCYRNNQDMGSLFDVREAWFLQHGGEE